MIPVYWLRLDGEMSRGFWDQAMLGDLMAGDLWSIPGCPPLRHECVSEVPAGPGAIVVLPGRFHATEDLPERVFAQLEKLDWCFLIITSDEEGLFPWWRWQHETSALWVQTPRPSEAQAHANVDLFIPEGYNPDVRSALSMWQPEPRTFDWMFAGQITHSRRRQMVDEMLGLGNAWVHQTSGFAQGIDASEYAARLASATVVPCPSGPVTPDSFRFGEALEAGCIPLLDTKCPGYDESTYWSHIFDRYHADRGNRFPFPLIDSWVMAPESLFDMLDQPHFRAAQTGSWWIGYKRWLTQQFQQTLERFVPRRPLDLQQRITVVIPTSPVAAHPDTSMIETTIASIHERLGAVEILLMCDGVRVEQQDRWDDYYEYLHRLCDLAQRRWRNVWPIVFDYHHHQARMMKETLRYVRSDALLFMEHDTPLQDEVPFEDLMRAMDSGRANVIRLYHEQQVPSSHRHLMLDDGPGEVEGVSLMRTSQWSQRPHLAWTSYYRWLADTYFGSRSSTMIEDVMHGVLSYACREHGEVGWAGHRVHIYAPGAEGTWQRSGNLDGRQTDPKYDMVYEYDGSVPEGAPQATSLRIEGED